MSSSLLEKMRIEKIQNLERLVQYFITICCFHYYYQHYLKGFYLGDGAGVGKGRQIAGCIYENFRTRELTKHVWLSASSDLINDARRDLSDIGLSEDELRCVDIKQLGYEKRDWKDLDNCILFVTYTSLVNKSAKLKVTRFERLIAWLGDNFEGLLIFDEGHKAKNLIFKESAKTTGRTLLHGGIELTGTQAGQAVFRLQDKLPRARILYASATGVTEVLITYYYYYHYYHNYCY